MIKHGRVNNRTIGIQIINQSLLHEMGLGRVFVAQVVVCFCVTFPISRPGCRNFAKDSTIRQLTNTGTTNYHFHISSMQNVHTSVFQIQCLPIYHRIEWHPDDVSFQLVREGSVSSFWGKIMAKYKKKIQKELGFPHFFNSNMFSIIPYLLLTYFWICASGTTRMEARSLSPYSPSVIISTPLSRRLQKVRRYARLFHVSFLICSKGWWTFLQQGWCTHLAIEKRLWLHFPAGTRNDKPSSPGVKSRWLTCIQCCFATENVDTCSLNHPLLSKHSGCSSHLLSWLFQTVTYNGIWAWDHFNRTTCFCQFAMFVQNVSPSLLCYGFHKLWTAILKKRHFSNWWFPWQFRFHMTNLTHDMAGLGGMQNIMTNACLSEWCNHSATKLYQLPTWDWGNNISSDIAVTHTHTQAHRYESFRHKHL